MKRVFWALVLVGIGAAPAAAANDCAKISGDAVLEARTPQVDLYEAPNGKRLQTLEDDRFPKCLPVTARAPNMMLQVNIGGANVWVPPYMVKYRLGGKNKAICRNLQMGGSDTKVGATRALGEDCPKPEQTP